MRFPNPQLAQQWRERLERFECSELSVAQFCEREGFSVASFYQWRRKLAATGGSQAGPQIPAFVPVDVKAVSLLQHDHNAIRIELPGGAIVKLSQTATLSEQRDLIQAILQATAEVVS